MGGDAARLTAPPGLGVESLTEGELRTLSTQLDHRDEGRIDSTQLRDFLHSHGKRGLPADRDPGAVVVDVKISRTWPRSTGCAVNKRNNCRVVNYG